MRRDHLTAARALRRPTPLAPRRHPGASASKGVRPDDMMITFRQAQVVRSYAYDIAPAGPACLNNNAPHRRGRTVPSGTARRIPCLSEPATEAKRS
jgi:hypothetical protein